MVIRGAFRDARQRGVAAVEFALILPLLIVVLFGIVDFGLMIYNKAMITNAAREGARAGIVLRNPPMPIEEVKTIAGNYCSKTLIKLVGKNEGCNVTVQVIAPAAPYDRNRLSVAVDYTYDGPITSLIGLVGGSLQLGKMNSVAVMLYE